jgi:hypothetical protein
VLGAGGFGLVVLDLGEVPRRMLAALPFTTWLRLQRLIAGSDTACVVMAEMPLARSAGGATVRLEPRPSTRPRMAPDPPRFREQVLASRHPFVVTRSAPPAPRSLWTGELPSVRRFRGLAVDAHVQSGLRTATCPIDLAASTRVECSPASV